MVIYIGVFEEHSLFTDERPVSVLVDTFFSLHITLRKLLML